MTPPTLGLTGSTGALGGLVARSLSDAGVRTRLLARRPERAPALAGAVTVASSYANDPAARAALDGVATLFMVSASESADRLGQHLAFVDAAAAAGVQHIVYTSFFGAAPDATFTLARDHWATEQHIAASGMKYTFLRDNFYLDLFPLFVGDDDVLRGPAGDGRVAAVARQDVARVAVTVLQDPGSHSGAVYDLTGPEELSLVDVADILTAHFGRPISYRDETVAEAYQSRRKWDAPDWQYDAWVSTYTAMAADELVPASSAVRDITGEYPISLRTYLARHDPT